VGIVDEYGVALAIRRTRDLWRADGAGAVGVAHGFRRKVDGLESDDVDPTLLFVEFKVRRRQVDYWPPPTIDNSDIDANKLDTSRECRWRF
jgi:hypothetical protein